MKKLVSRLAMGIALLGLTLALLAVPALAQSGSSATTTTTTTTSASKRSETCSAVRERLAGAPEILSRIETNLARLNAQLDRARLPTRRTSLEDRIERLVALRTQLAQKIADARRACGTV